MIKGTWFLRKSAWNHIPHKHSETLTLESFVKDKWTFLLSHCILGFLCYSKFQLSFISFIFSSLTLPLCSFYLIMVKVMVKGMVKKKKKKACFHHKQHVPLYLPIPPFQRIVIHENSSHDGVNASMSCVNLSQNRFLIRGAPAKRVERNLWWRNFRHYQKHQ